jgi:hypothetical protein
MGAGFLRCVVLAKVLFENMETDMQYCSCYKSRTRDCSAVKAGECCSGCGKPIQYKPNGLSEPGSRPQGFCTAKAETPRRGLGWSEGLS